MKNLKLILTFFTLWLSVFLDQMLENYLAYFCILSLGVLHGANDLEISEKTLAKNSVLSKKGLLLLVYIACILSITLLLLQFPAFTLFLFILLSAYHFGEQHWEALISNKGMYSKLFMMSYGMTILCLLFLAHQPLVSQIVFDIAGFSVSNSTIKIIFIVSSAAMVALYAIKLNSKFNFQFTIRQLFYFLVFFLVFNSTTLLWAFAIYFIFWHSLPSLFDQMFFLYGRKDAKGFLQFLKSSILYWAMAVLFLVGYSLFFTKGIALNLSLFFAFLTALTIPHIFIMYFLKKVS